jgi:acetylornithine deacetylase/succinyl-diaminopimelate desuccinylase-like protein
MTRTLDTEQALSLSERIWEKDILPALTEYIRIPNVSQGFDREWREHGHMEKAVALIEAWCRKQPIPGLTVEIARMEGRSPLIVMEVPATTPGPTTDTVLLYGHLDKQPEMTGWREGLSAWTPVREGDHLYGRGGADDGYSAFASLTALRLLSEQKIPHARAVILIEASEESGSPDLPAYMDKLATKIGKPSLVVCLDSGCANYDQLWSTTSLRGSIGGMLRIDVLSEGVHSGGAGGIVPDTFRLLRQLLSRVEDEKTGMILPKDLHVEIPAARRAQVDASVDVLRGEVRAVFPWVAAAGPGDRPDAELLLDRTWRPCLAVTGAEGLPEPAKAGNVLRPFTAVKVSVRIPPRVDPSRATNILKETFEKDPPYGARVTFTAGPGASGWDAPPLAPWLETATDAASRAFFGKPVMYMGEGGTIPFMAMLGERFPEAQFLITGLLGPGSNAHGPNEFLHIPAGKRLTCCVASVLAAHLTRG